ncbi:uncharacterized protein [Primulina huaijiensis]|uniref:uncharacterized protein n=1 Tax=Primulina huaijiensis TaxID=1492673 RepID=UPI003CC75DFB
MSYMNRVWMAASVAIVNTQPDQGQKLKSGLQTLNHGKKHFFHVGGEAADIRPFSGILNCESVAFRGEDMWRKQSEESLRQVMYLNCWGQS